jgi:hypothetical protein
VKPRHAAALALVGWYLMLPPFPYSGPSKFEVDTDASLDKWKIFASYDTASECTVDLLEMHKKSEKYLPKMLAKKGKGLGYAEISAELMAQCIASDDPRLKGR